MALFSTTTPSSGSASGQGCLLSDQEFTQLRDFIYNESGIFIADNRKYLVKNRLANRLRELNLNSFEEYYYYLRFDANKRAELTQLFAVITTNETSFYRNPPQLQMFQEKALKRELDKQRAAGRKKLRIWSAGCSTGEEPYTLAIILHEVLKTEISDWDIKITANDLSEAVLLAAGKGLYSMHSLRTTPQNIVAKYFTMEGSSFRINPKLKRIISFGTINLSNKHMLTRVEKSNFIFCRNVIIYFDDAMKHQVINSFYDNLLPGGTLFIGHSESLHNISRAFKPEHLAGAIVYRKQE
jgi:Methylase of chemotaxis methyl-accepting proteins